MASEPQRGWHPDWGVAPGDVLLEALQERRMTQTELARRIDRPIKTVNEIVKGKTAITPETALQLERALGIDARVWNSLEALYRDHLARRASLAELEDFATWIDDFPITDLIRHNVVRKGTSKAETLAELLKFFGVSSPTAWEREWLRPSASFRLSPAFEASPHAVAAWLRWGEIEAERERCEAYDARRFRNVLKWIRTLTTREPFLVVIETIRAECTGAGVVVVLTPELKGTRLSGAARWLAPDQALIQLSLRHKTDDQFWFTFFHEAGHLLHGAKGRDFIDQADDDQVVADQGAEAEANEFARNILIPSEDYRRFCARADFSSESIRRFARSQQIAPGIVVGRLQRDGRLAHSQLNHLKKRLRWN